MDRTRELACDRENQAAKAKPRSEFETVRVGLRRTTCDASTCDASAVICQSTRKSNEHANEMVVE